MPKKFLTTLASLGLLFGAPAGALATGDLHYSADTTLTLGVFTVTIKAPSDATSLIINDNGTLTVTVPQNETFTLSIPLGNSLTASPTSIEQSCGDPNSISVTGPATTTITPSAAQCTKGTTVVSGGASSNTTPTTTIPPVETAKPTSDTSKTFTFEAPKETKSQPAAPEAPSAGSKEQLKVLTTLPLPEVIQEIREVAKEIVAVPKKITLDADDKQILAEAKKVGVTIDTTGSGKKATASATKANAFVVNFLTTDTAEALEDMTLQERAQVLKEAQYFIGGKVKNEADVTKALKLAEGIALSDKELGKKVLNDIKRNENAFCKPGVCKGYAVFASVLRGGDPGDLSPAQEKKGIAAFRKNVGRAPSLTNPLHLNLVEAFAVADLSKVKAPAKKVPKKKKK